ncbi:MAG: organic solvent tolerance protein OstA [Treponema sp.]|nr:organic solvent tolerance protein OstA [Treponema sp.]
MKKLFSLLILFSLYTALFAEKITFSAGSMSGQAGDSSATTTLTGGAFVQTSSIEISADSIELSGDDYRFIKATGNISGKNLESKMEFTCDSMSYDRETKVAQLQGNVKLVDTENDVKADAQLIEYNQNTNIAVLQIGITLTQKKNVCTGAYAVYQKNEQMLEISGNAQVKQEEDVFRAQQITLNLDTQNITLSGNVKGSVTETKKKEEETVETEQSTDTKQPAVPEPVEGPAEQEGGE